MDFAFLAVAVDGGFDCGERSGEGAGLDEVCDDVGPKAGEGFVIAGVFAF